MSKDNSGPAFPHHFTQDSVGDCAGMSLRDWFAGQALAGLMANSAELRNITTPMQTQREADLSIAQAIYELADAALAERAK